MHRWVECSRLAGTGIHVALHDEPESSIDYCEAIREVALPFGTADQAMTLVDDDIAANASSSIAIKLRSEDPSIFVNKAAEYIIHV